MAWIIMLLVTFGFIGYVGLLNAKPTRCPLCNRINVFRRTRTGPWRDEHDEEGILLRTAAEFVCKRCRGSYWIVWDDFAGCQAEVPPGPDS